METTNPDEINLKKISEEYLDLSARGVTLDQFLTYLETDHSEFIAVAFKARLLRDSDGNLVL